MKKTILYAATILLVGCGTVKLISPSQSDVDRVSTKYPGYTLADLDQGKSNFETKCTHCHRLRNPAAHTEEQWNKIVPRMVAKANKKTIWIDPVTQESILKYLATMSAPPKVK